MIVARYFRADLVTGALDQPIDYVPLLRGTPEFMHGQAMMFAKRRGADAYQLCEGNHAYALKPISLTYDIRGHK